MVGVDYPTPDCLFSEEIEALFAGQEMSGRLEHLDQCATCAAMLEMAGGSLQELREITARFEGTAAAVERPTAGTVATAAAAGFVAGAFAERVVDDFFRRSRQEESPRETVGHVAD